jgi:hypothetical protein
MLHMFCATFRSSSDKTGWKITSKLPGMATGKRLEPKDNTKRHHKTSGMRIFQRDYYEFFPIWSYSVKHEAAIQLYALDKDVTGQLTTREIPLLVQSKILEASNTLIPSSMYCTYLMLCWPCIIVYQYSETNVMHFLFSLLRSKSLYMFRALLAHPQEELHKQNSVYWMHVMSVGCTRIGPHSNPGTANWHNTHAVYQVSFVQRLLKMSK